VRRAWRRAVKSWNNDNTAAQGAGAVAKLAAARKTARYAAATVLPLVGQDAGAVGS